MTNYYVFNGQNASTGEPNKVTGRVSFYGTVLAFETKKEALKYVEDNERCEARYITVAGTKSDMRKYCLGSSVDDFEYSLGQNGFMKLIGRSWVESY